MVLITGNTKDLEEVIEELNKQIKESGLKISRKKIKILEKRERKKVITLQRREIECVEEIIYLEQCLLW